MALLLIETPDWRFRLSATLDRIGQSRALRFIRARSVEVTRARARFHALRESERQLTRG